MMNSTLHRKRIQIDLQWIVPEKWKWEPERMTARY
jgi:hypothetical protein